MTPTQAQAALNKVYKSERTLRTQLEEAEHNTRLIEKKVADMVEVKKTSAAYVFTRKSDGLKVWMTNRHEWPTVYWHKNGKQTKQIAEGIDANANQMNWVSHVVQRLATHKDKKTK